MLPRRERLGQAACTSARAVASNVAGVRNALEAVQNYRLRMKPTMSFTALMVSDAMTLARAAPSIST